ncbi:MAG: GHKL domain-containing protein [Desulfobacteraceae bacterium]|nr:GHKL domain-containing protein [Desulfobacteraceae bacterium]
MAITQDKYGFMWFATQDGLNRYNGYDFKIFKHVPGDKNSLSGNHIIAVYEDKDGVLWIGTNGGGLNRYNTGRETFVHYKHDSDDPMSISDNRVTAICEDNLGELWVGTEKGLNKFDRKTKKFKRYQNDINVKDSLSFDNIKTIHKDGKGLLWIGTKNGLNRYDPEHDNFIHYKHDPADPKSISDNSVWSIYDDGNFLWICTFGGGLNRFDRNDGTFTRYIHIPDKNSVNDNYTTRVYKDKHGVLWIGTKSGGLNRFDQLIEYFSHYQHNYQDRHSLSHNYITAIYEDMSGVIWIGTLAGGLNKFKKLSLKNSIEYYTHIPNNNKSLSNQTVWSVIEDKERFVWIGTDKGVNRFDRTNKEFKYYFNDLTDSVRVIYEDRDGILWFGTFSEGLLRYDRNTKNMKRYKTNPDNPSALSSNTIISIYEDSMGILWLGSWDGGLNKFDRINETFKNYKKEPHNPYSLSNNIVRCVYEDSRKNLWIGTNDGLNKLDRKTQKFDKYRANENETKSLSNNTVRCIYEGRNGDIWIGTNGGLNNFNTVTGEFESYRESDGLVNETVYGILEDLYGTLWLSTNKGLSSFDPISESFRNYDVRDGLQSNEFNAGAYHKNRNGELFFGGINGFNIFHPYVTKLNKKNTPSVILTEFQKFYQDVKFDEPIQDIEEIILSRKDMIFSFNFATVDYTDSRKNQYKYKLENFDREWINAKTRRSAAYTNLDPGKYIFKVKGSNSDGIWSNEISTSVIVIPSWWETWWFKAILLIIICIFLYISLKFYKLREQFNGIAAIGRYMAHEISNPLASMRVTCDLVSKIYQEKDVRVLRMLKNLSYNIIEIDEGIKSFGDLDPSVKKTNYYEPIDILSLTKEVIESFQERRKLEEIYLEINFNNKAKVKIFPTDFKVIFRNLLLNAIDAVNQKEIFENSENYRKQIAVNFKYGIDERNLLLEIKDNGIGMNKKTIRACRQLYFSTKNQRNYEKSLRSKSSMHRTRGMGLHIVQDKIDKYNMKLEIESKEKEGSLFRLSIPITGENR